MHVSRPSGGSSTSRRYWGGLQRSSDVMKRGVVPRTRSTDAGGEGLGEVTFVVNEQAKLRNRDPGMVAFVTGANRGIGLEITRQLLEKTAGQ